MADAMSTSDRPETASRLVSQLGVDRIILSSSSRVVPFVSELADLLIFRQVSYSSLPKGFCKVRQHL